MLKKVQLVIWLVIFAVGCNDSEMVVDSTQNAGIEESTEALQIGVTNSDVLIIEATSFAGEPLYRRNVDVAKKARYQQLIDQLNQKDSLSEDEYIALGGYYISLNRFRDAIDVYSRGLQELPDSFKLRRFRGHRYISVRELDKAIIDLNEALVLLQTSQSESEIEYSADGKPHESYQYWVWYHIGLYHYLNANYAQAVQAYGKCIEMASEDKYLVGVTDWLYNSYQKSGNTQAAQLVLKAISSDIDADKSHPYFKRIMLYKGLVSVEEILDLDKPIEQWTVRDMTIAYGIANWLGYQGNTKASEKLHKNILKTPFWNSWAYVATDKEYAQ